MAVNKVIKSDGTTLIDITGTTATASDVAEGKRFFAADGTEQTGTAVMGGGSAIAVVDTEDSHGGTIRTITAVDLSADTVTAATLLQGYRAHDRLGNAIVGTASGGGETINLQEKTGVNPSTSSQTITPDSGYDGLSSVQINAMPTGTAGTPTASKGTVSNHSVTVTPSVTNSTGYITGGTKSGTAVTVSASELVSGSETKTENGTYDVTNLASLVVNVPTGGGGDAQSIYSGSSAPSSSLGVDGDLYMQMESGASVEKYPADYTSQSVSGTSGLDACIGTSAEDGHSTANVYSSGSGTTGHVYYTFDLSDIPSNATIKSVSCVVKAHEENASRSTMTVQLYAGSTAKGSVTTVSGTSNANYTLDVGTWTRAELDSLQMVMSVGYYGGLIAGATLTISYETDPQWTASLIGNGSGITMTSGVMYKKDGGAWVKTASVALADLIARK